MLSFLPRPGSRFFALLLALTAGATAHAQSLGNAPYSRLGLGEVPFGAGLVRNQGMAGVGVAAPHPGFVNELNPALAWQTSSVTFDMAAAGQIKTLKTAIQSQRTGDATLSYFALALPITPRWGATVGLRPLTAVDYQNRNLTGVDGDPNGVVEVQNKGEGGLAQAYMAHGVRLFGGLSAGAEASYVFGSVESTSSTRLLAGTGIGASDERTVLLERRRYGDFLFRGGLAYQQKLKDKLSLGIGAAFQLGKDLHTTRRRTQERRSVSQSDATLESLILADSLKGQVTLPWSLTGGVSLVNGSAAALGVDVQYQPWSQFRTDGVAQHALADSWRVSAGGEWIPDPISADSYFKRIAYRAGIYAGQTGWRDHAGHALRDAGVTWGFALPLGRVVSFENATVQTSFAYGQRGHTTDGAVKESYLRAQLGISFSSTWFVKRRID